MDKLHYLSHCRKRYFNLTKLYLAELERGVSIESLILLKNQLESLIKDINDLENELGITNTPSE